MTNEASSWPLYSRELGRRREEGCKKTKTNSYKKSLAFCCLIISQRREA